MEEKAGFWGFLMSHGGGKKPVIQLYTSKCGIIHVHAVLNDYFGAQVAYGSYVCGVLP